MRNTVYGAAYRQSINPTYNEKSSASYARACSTLLLPRTQYTLSTFDIVQMPRVVCSIYAFISIYPLADDNISGQLKEMLLFVCKNVMNPFTAAHIREQH